MRQHKICTEDHIEDRGVISYAVFVADPANQKFILVFVNMLLLLVPLYFLSFGETYQNCAEKAGDTANCTLPAVGRPVQNNILFTQKILQKSCSFHIFLRVKHTKKEKKRYHE